MMKTTQILRWNSRPCGRCGGTGAYNVASGYGVSARTCYGCGGAGIKMSAATKANMFAFRAWAKEVGATWEQKVAELETGRFGRAWQIITKEA